MTRLILVSLISVLAWPALAQERRPSQCFAIAQTIPGAAYVQKAAWQDGIADEFSLRISYIDHSMFLLQTHGGLSAVTDYNGFIGAVPLVPDVVTMNNAHGTHWTAAPHPDIPHVLEGWRQGGQPADYYVDLGEMLIRNATTDIRNRSGGGLAIADNNSIFIFEAAGLCIGHLGHLHHEPSDETYAAIGRLDVVMAAVDGGLTVDTDTMIRIVTRLRSSIVLPMHWWTRGSLDQFIAGLGPEFDVQRPGTSHMELSLRTLPSRPTVMVLEPRFLRRDD
jgi:L-ascorbate metabolism protein UlaG (beta-lactamase superfamily)